MALATCNSVHMAGLQNQLRASEIKPYKRTNRKQFASRPKGLYHLGQVVVRIIHNNYLHNIPNRKINIHLNHVRNSFQLDEWLHLLLKIAKTAKRLNGC